MGLEGERVLALHVYRIREGEEARLRPVGERHGALTKGAYDVLPRRVERNRLLNEL